MAARGGPFVGSAAPIGLILTLALLAVGCGGRASPTLEATGTPTVPPFRPSVSVDDTPPGVGTSGPPVLLGFDIAFDPADIPGFREPWPLEGVAGEIAGFGEPVTLDGSLQQAPAGGDDPSPAAVVSTDGGAASAPETTGSADGGEVTSEPEASQTPVPDAASGDEGVGETVEPGFPAPPPAVPGPEPEYVDPSAAVLYASGRPLELFGEVEDPRTAGLTDDVITVGGVVTQTIAGLPHRADACLGAAARALQANEHDELTRRIDVTECLDDSGQAPISDGMARSLVRDGTFAVVPVASGAFLGDIVLNESRVPYVGADALPGYCGRTSRFGFGVLGASECPVLDARGFVALTQPVLSVWDASRGIDATPAAVTLLVEDSAAGAVVRSARTLEAELIGLEGLTVRAVLPDPASATPSSWKAVARQILDTAPEVVVLDGTNVYGLPAELRRAGFDGEIVLVGRFDPLLIADEDWRTAMAPATLVSLGIDLASATPGRDALEGAAAAIGVPADAVSLAFVEGYLAMDFFVQAVAATPEPLSAEALADRINSGWWYPGVAGLGCGSWWPSGHFIETPCVSVAAAVPYATEAIPVLGLVETVPQLEFALAG